MSANYRIERTGSGRVVFEGWAEPSEPAAKPRHYPRAKRLPVGAKPAWTKAPGTQVLPRCAHCESPMVWRGRWHCDVCVAKGLAPGYDLLALPSSLPSEALVGVPVLSARVNPRPHAPATATSADGKGAAGAAGKANLTLPSEVPEGAAPSTRDGRGSPLLSSSEGNNSTSGAPGESADSAWLGAVEATTSFHRAHAAKRLELRGLERDRQRRKNAPPSPAATDAYRLALGIERGSLVNERETEEHAMLAPWYAQRIRGQAERFEKVRACGELAHALEHHGQVIPLRKRCDCWRVCRRCQRRRRAQLTAAMTDQRQRILRHMRRETARFYKGKEGRASEKMFTFTVPKGDSPAADAALIVELWQVVLRKMRAYWAEKRGLRKGKKLVPMQVPWCRIFEVGPGRHAESAEDRTGLHAHMHVWAVCPFVDVILLRKWWGDLLIERGIAVNARQWKDVRGQRKDGRKDPTDLERRLGNPRDDTWMPWPIVHVVGEKSAGASAMAAYTQKVGLAMYVQKGSEVLAMEPAHVAKVYEVFEGKRAYQWARGWAPVKVRRYSGARFRRLTEIEREALLQRRTTRVGATKIQEFAKEIESRTEMRAEGRRSAEQLTFDHTWNVMARKKSRGALEGADP